MIPKPEQAHWALQEAAIRAEINQAKANVDLLRMANAVARLDKLHSEMETAGKSTYRAACATSTKCSSNGAANSRAVGSGPGPDVAI